jgi:hypothetical protein
MNRIEILFKYRNKGIGKYGKTRFELQIRYDKIVTCWLSNKQKNNIETWFYGFTESCPSRIVYAAFEEDRFIWCGLYSKWLCQTFNANEDSIPDSDLVTWPGEIPFLAIPEKVEIADELKDTIA